jgi:SAM-dependent methyltransferase
MKIVVFGGNGTLGKELQKIDGNLICPSKNDVDIRNLSQVEEFIKLHTPDIIINSAAIIDNRAIETNPREAIETNIIGAANLSIICSKYDIRLVYLSTDYVYQGNHGNCKESDPILPFNLYTWTKVGGEASVNAVKNHLIIRTSFGKNEFSYSVAFIDKWASKDYVDKIAPLIYEASISPLIGILNLGTERKTLFSYAKERNPDVSPIKLSETSFNTPYDTSLNLQKWIDYKSNSPIAKSHTHCRACNSTKLTKYLDLGLMPLSNNLETSSKLARNKQRFPLQVMVCEQCFLTQLSVVIDPKEMYSYYTYRSSVNKPYLQHCRKMAKDLREKYHLSSSSFHIDIASNDGSLLKEFKEEIGIKVLGVDPAENLAAIAESIGVPTIADFWSRKTGIEIISKYGNAQLISATNVFAHIDNINEFIQTAKNVLSPNGILIIECPYLRDFIEENEWNQCYFEHLSHISISPINSLCDTLGMKIIDVSKHNIHGGTIRITIAKQESRYDVSPSVHEFIKNEDEKGYTSLELYSKWQSKVKDSISSIGENLLNLKKKGYKLSGFGASAKGNTLLNACNVTTDIMDVIIDETSEKIGKFSPGTGIPIVHKRYLQKTPPDYLVILAENFKEELIKRAKDVGYEGKFIVCLPKFEIID